MKKYLQACEMGGSIYGKKKPADERFRSIDRNEVKEDLMGSYSKFYRHQVVRMNKLFQRPE
ncbi:hypothetical protein ACFL5Y_00340 [Candidatus Omnitrophota bacterium]